MNKKKILFLCTENSARSQMAEGIMRYFRADEFEAFSAGTEPKGVHPKAAEILREIGIDISNQRSKHLDEFADQTFDYIITLCDHAAQSCPAVLRKGNLIHHSFSDPAAVAGDDEALTDAFRKVRDRLKEFILAFDERKTQGV